MLRGIFLFLLYCFYGLVLIVALLFIFFPRDRFLLWAAGRVEQELPGFECRIEEVRYEHPFKLRFNQMILENQSERISLPIDTLLAGFEKKWPIENLHVSAVLYGGVLESDLMVTSEKNRITLSNLSATSIRLQDAEFLQKRLDRQITGNLSITGKMVILGGTDRGIEFAGKIKIDQFNTKLRRPVLGFSELDFAQVVAVLNLDHTLIELTEGRYAGELIDGNFAGSVMVQEPWQESRIDIEGGVIPQDLLLERDPLAAEAAARLYREYREEAIPCQIDGTVQEPRFKFGRKNS